MYVGVILRVKRIDCITTGIPHVCGGDPFINVGYRLTLEYSPCMWG